MIALLSLSGCMTLDFFFFDPTPVDEYAFEATRIDRSQIQEVGFASADGTWLTGVWLWQDDPEAADTVLHFHGNAGNLDTHLERLELFWSYGYNVVSFDYRGYGTSEGSPDHDGVLADGVAAVEHVMDGLNVDSGQLYFHGVSLGGYVALNVAEDYPPAALITENTFSSGENLASTNAQVELAPAWLFEGEWDSMAAAARMQGVPYLVIHGDSDNYILPEHAQWLYEAANEPKELWMVPGGDHGPVTDSLRHYQLLPEEYEAHVTGWFEDHPAN